MSYIFDITSKGSKSSYNTVKDLFINKFKFDGSTTDKVELLTICRKFAKFVSPKVNSVRYCTHGDSSYTDGKDIVISSEVLPTTYDSTIGLVLHESSHVAITDFDGFVSKINTYKGDKKKNKRLIKDILNWVEDRRIDNWNYNKYIGYQKYYEALYRRYFLSDIVDTLIDKNSLEVLKETINNYMFYIINSINPKVTMTELQGLPEIQKIIDIDNIGRLKSTMDALDVAEQIYDIMMKYVIEEKYDTDSKYDLTNGEINLDDLTEDIIGDIISSILGRHSKFGNGEIDDSIVITISINETNEINAEIKDKEKNDNVEEYNISKDPNIEDYLTRDDLKVYVIKKTLIEDMKSSEIYPIFGNDYAQYFYAVDKGIKLGKSLKNKLRFREEERELIYANQKNGKINKSKLHSCVVEPDKIFYKKEISKYDTLNIHITVDASSSMAGERWQETLTFISAIATATLGMKGINVQISYRYTLTKILCNIVYDSRYDDIKKIKALKYTRPCGGTPEGLVYMPLINGVLKDYINKNTIFINFSDGEPQSNAIKVTKESVKFLKKSGVEVLSYFINNDGEINKTFLEMYGEKSSFFIKTNNMRDLVKSLNRKFLNVGK